jgi:glycosyltransferase involved in cell wall biosynthesis
MAANGVHVMKMCYALSQHGVKVTLVVPGTLGKNFNENEIFEFYGISPGSFGLKQINSPFKFINLPFFLFGLTIFLINHPGVNVYGRSVFGCLISSLLGKKTVFEAHAPVWEIDWFHKISFSILRSLNSFIRLVVISNKLKEYYLGMIPENMIEVYHDGADAIGDIDLPTTKNIGKPIFGYVGGLYNGKGIDTVIKMAELLPSDQFLVYGGNQEQIAYWKEQTNAQNICFKGHVPHSKIKMVYESFDIGLLPNKSLVSTHNGGKINISSYTSPLKLFEYMANNKLIFSSDFEVLREVLNENNSFLLQSDEIEQWVNAANQVKENPGAAVKKIRNASALFNSSFTWKVRALNIIQIY